MTINNKSERNYRGKCLGWPVTSYGGEHIDWSITYLTNSKQFLLGAKSGRRYIGGDTILGTTHTHNCYLQNFTNTITLLVLQRHFSVYYPVYLNYKRIHLVSILVTGEESLCVVNVF